MLRWSTRTDEASWLLAPGLDLDIGPSGFDAYARLRLVPDPIKPGQQEGDLPTWHGTFGMDLYDAPSFVWPRDRAWCIAWDVDPHFAGVGGSGAAIDALLDVARLHAVPHDPTTRAPYYY